MTSDSRRIPGDTWAERAALLASIIALLETTFVYVTGFAPVYDVLLIWACGFVLCLGWGAALSGAVRVIGRVVRRSVPRHGRLRDLGLLLFPPLLFALRGNVDPSQVSHAWGTPARWGTTLAVLIVLTADALAERRHFNEPMTSKRFLLISWLSALVVVSGFAARTLDFTATGDVVATSLVLRLGTMLAALGMSSLFIWRLNHRETGWGFGHALVAPFGFLLISIGVASLLCSEPPRLGPPQSSGVSEPPQRSPSVILIVLDTVRRDHVSVYGYPLLTTPTLERFASTAIVFENARAAASYSLSTHASLFTGLLPSAHGAHPIPPGAAKDETQNPGHYRLRRSVDTLAEELQGEGYITAGISANDMFLARWTGLQRGFSQFTCDARRRYRFFPTVAPVLSRLGPRVQRTFSVNAEWPADSVTEGALEWLSGTAGRPFFLFLNYFDAHDPYDAPPPYNRRFPAQGESAEAQWVSQYDGEIAYVDNSLARLFEGMRASGVFEDTLIIVTSDHGEFFGERGLVGHADLLYEPVLQIPLIVKLPRQQQALSTLARVGQWQLREIVQRVKSGGASPEELVAALDKPGPKLMAESWNPGPGAAPTELPASRPRSRAIYMGPFKLVERAGAADWLFDLHSDPREEHDLASQDPGLARALRMQVGQTVELLERLAEDPEPAEIDEAVLQKLRSLGYVNGSSRSTAPVR